MDFVNEGSIKNNHLIGRERDWGGATEYSMVTRQLTGLLEITDHEFKKASQSVLQHIFLQFHPAVQM